MVIFLRKVFRDLSENKMQSAFVIIAISIGIIGAGSIITSYAILNYEIDNNFSSTKPPNFILHSSNVSDEMITLVNQYPGVDVAQQRGEFKGRIQSQSGDWIPLKLMVVKNFESIDVSKFELESGIWPQNNQIAVERSSMLFDEISLNRDVTIKTASGTTATLNVTGVVHDSAQAPGWQDGISYGYISTSTLVNLGEQSPFNQIHVLIEEHSDDLNEISQFAYELYDYLESLGFAITGVVIPEPGQHPHTDQMNSLIFLIQVFGILSQILGGLLVYITISSLLQEQIKEIGIMKAIGGKRRKLLQIYYSYVMILSTISLLIGVPLGNWLGGIFSSFMASMLNFDITSGTIPFWVYATEISLGYLISTLAATIPIVSSSNKSVNEALTSHKNTGNSFGERRSDRFVSKIKLFNLPLRLSIRNTFRRRIRLVLLLLIMGLGGAVFISAWNISTSWDNTIYTGFESRLYDLKVDFAEPYPVETVDNFLTGISEVKSYEYWDQVPASYGEKNTQNGIIFRLTGVPKATEMIDFPLLKGRWFNENDTNALIINHELYYDEETDIDLGDTINLEINNQVTEWEVIGIIQELGAPRRGFGTPASAYVSKDHLSQFIGTYGETTSLRIKVDHSKVASVEEFSQELENKFYENGFKLNDIQASSVRLQILKNHLVVIIAFLAMMAALIAVVGMLALMSVTTINIMERTREIGILRAIGATNKKINNIIVKESVVIGFLSWIIAIIFSVPITILAGNYAGWIFIHSRLQFVYEWYPFVIWLVLILVISIYSTSIPMKRSIKKTVNVALQHE